MIKRLISILLVTAIISVSGCSNYVSKNESSEIKNEADNSTKGSVDDYLLPVEETWDAAASGIVFTKNDRLKKAKGSLFKYDHGKMENSNMLMFAAIYAAITKDDYKKLTKDVAKLIDNNGTTNEIQELTGKFYSHITSLFNVYAIREGSTLDDFKSKVGTLLDSEKDLNDFFDNNVITPIGGMNGWYYFYVYSKPEKVSGLDLLTIGSFKDDYLDLLSHADEYKNDIRIKMPLTVEEQQFTRKIMFTAKDLDGNTYISDQLFRNYKITMVNVWATYCAPCVGEMPTFEKLSKEFSEDGYGMIGIIADGDTKSKDAKEIIKATGVTYPNICLNEDLQRLLQIQVTPTTYFVDKKGNILGDPIYGARKESQYKYELESRLSLIE